MKQHCPRPPKRVQYQLSQGSKLCFEGWAPHVSYPFPCPSAPYGVQHRTYMWHGYSNLAWATCKQLPCPVVPIDGRHALSSRSHTHTYHITLGICTWKGAFHRTGVWVHI